MSIIKKKLTILYGSQTGCSQEVAERVEREAKRRWFETKISSMDNFDFVNFSNLQFRINYHKKSLFFSLVLQQDKEKHQII